MEGGTSENSLALKPITLFKRKEASQCYSTTRDLKGKKHNNFSIAWIFTAPPYPAHTPASSTTHPPRLPQSLVSKEANQPEGQKVMH